MERKSAAEWRPLVEAWIESGKTCAKFAESRGLVPATLGWWRWKLGLNEVSSKPQPTFHDVVVAEPRRMVPDLVVEVGGVRVRVQSGFDAHEVRRLVDALC